ncbi:Glucose-induced degradation protein 8 like protein [Astathelohania contejeani]|uniref:Glucose-induced degradation protein 8 like protein n=1 Tax=Astathelohania contejeani TaxID=164912 RepID=A0ABQ7I2S0_9MICR|nr:Glucose-induced degradation protein 8 like protein [Thelohania contejeani]
MNKSKDNSNEKLVIQEKEWRENWDSIKIPHLNKMLFEYFIQEGMIDMAKTLAEELEYNLEISPNMQARYNIRSSLEKGNVEHAIALLNSLNTEILDQNIKLYYFLMEHKAFELIDAAHKEKEDSRRMFEILGFIQKEISEIVSTHPELVEHLEDMLVFLVFSSGPDIYTRRRWIASRVNNAINEFYGDSTNEYKELVLMVMQGEERLKTNYAFPEFKSYYRRWQ